MPLLRNSVIAIDPGPTESAYCVWDGKAIQACAILKNRDLILFLNSGLVKANNHLAIEWIQHFGMPSGASIFDTCKWVGLFIAEWGGIDSDYTLVTRREVKLYLCNSMQANDANVRRALKERVGEAGKKKSPGPTYLVKNDIWSALGVAITYWDARN